MPRLKASPQEQAAARFDGLLCAGRTQQGLTVEEMCRRAGFSKRKYAYNRTKPEQYSLAEIRTLASIVGVPLRELLGALAPTLDK